MSFVGMAWRYLRFRWLVSLLTVIGIGLGVALVFAVLALRHESEARSVKRRRTLRLGGGREGQSPATRAFERLSSRLTHGKFALFRFRKTAARLPGTMGSPRGPWRQFFGLSYRWYGTAIFRSSGPQWKSFFYLRER